MPSSGDDEAVGSFAAADVLPAAHLRAVARADQVATDSYAHNLLSHHRLNLCDGDRIQRARGRRAFDVGSFRDEGLCHDDVTHRILDDLIKASPGRAMPSPRSSSR